MMLVVQEGPSPNRDKSKAMGPQMFWLGGHLDIGRLAREHYDSVFRFCVYRVGIDRAPDAAQETFLTAQKVAKNFRGDAKPLTWLFGIAHNECRRIVRQHKLDPISPEFIEDPAGPSGEHLIIEREVLRQAMESLSQEHRDVVLLHEIEGLTYEEIAVIVGVPVGTVKSRLHHAFQNLRRFVYTPETGQAQNHSSTHNEVKP